jgi:hypothetical protein
VRKGLIIKKVWLDKIFDEGKVWEMRSTKTNLRGKVGLIESGTGLIMGEVIIDGCSENAISPTNYDLVKYHKVIEIVLLKKWKYAWFLSKAKRYDNPLPYHHPQGAVIWVNL